MNKNSILKCMRAVGFSVSSLLILISCDKHEASDKDADEREKKFEHRGVDHSKESVSKFEPEKGILLSAESLNSLGIQTTVVEKRSLSTMFSVSAQVYRGADEKTSMNGTYQKGCAYASASIPLSSTLLVNPGMEVKIHKADQPEVEKTAHILRMDDSLQSATQSNELLLQIPDPKQDLPIGTFLTAIFTSSESQSVTAIPQSALLKTSEGNFVYVKIDQHFLRTAVQLGSANADFIEVKEGVSLGATVATSGVESLWLFELRATKGGGEEQ